MGMIRVRVSLLTKWINKWTKRENTNHKAIVNRSADIRRIAHLASKKCAHAIPAAQNAHHYSKSLVNSYPSLKIKPHSEIFPHWKTKWSNSTLSSTYIWITLLGLVLNAENQQWQHYTVSPSLDFKSLRIETVCC